MQLQLHQKRGAQIFNGHLAQHEDGLSVDTPSSVTGYLPRHTCFVNENDVIAQEPYRRGEYPVRLGVSANPFE